jgi:hypothetical protein
LACNPQLLHGASQFFFCRPSVGLPAADALQIETQECIQTNVTFYMIPLTKEKYRCRNAIYYMIPFVKE